MATMKHVIALEVNGEVREMAVEPGETLLQVLRNQLGLLGAKRGCDSGGCGCCTVHLDGKAVYSCMQYARAVEGKRVTTVEGLARDGKLDPVQQAFIEAGAVQCGYCTCGIMMSAKQLLATRKAPDEEEIRHAIAGNLCRCTGYAKIVQAIKLAAAAA
jgi:aerobic-type carbon monoxide dehydrogenase small subunit (CoxS/CutS family)